MTPTKQRRFLQRLLRMLGAQNKSVSMYITCQTGSFSNIVWTSYKDTYSGARRKRELHLEIYYPAAKLAHDLRVVGVDVGVDMVKLTHPHDVTSFTGAGIYIEESRV